MQFSELMRTMRRDGDHWKFQVSNDWVQGRSVFGGLQAALLARTMRELVPDELPLRSLQTAFIAPVPAGEVTVHAQLLRAGKNVRQVEARIVAGGETLCLGLGVYGAAHESKVRQVPSQPASPTNEMIALTILPGVIDDMPHSMPAPVHLPYMPGLSPAFNQHFNARWLRGSLPLSGSDATQQVLELDLLDNGVDAVDETHMLAFTDFIAPIALSMLDKLVTASSLTWMVEFLRDDYADLGLLNWRVDAELIAARDGYTNQGLTLWAPDGQLVALSRQTMVIFG